MVEKKDSWEKNAILFLVSQSITLFGSTLVQMAIIWYVTLETSSGSWVAAFSVGAYLPQFLVSFLGGVWADRYNKKRLILWADGGIALVTWSTYVVLPLLPDGPAFLGVLLLMSVIRSVGAGIQTPAVNAVIPQIVPEKSLMRYNGLNATMQSMAQFAAPALAGIVLSVLSLRITLLIDVATAMAGIGALSRVKFCEAGAGWEGGSVFSDLRTGVRYSFSNWKVGRLLIIYGVFVFFCVPGGYMAGLFVSRMYGDTYWYLTAVELVGFAGMALGGLLMGIWGGFKSRVKTLAVGLAGVGVMAVGMGIVRNFRMYLAMMGLYGIALTVVQTATTTLIQGSSAEKMQGRVFGLMGSVYAGFLPVGMMVFGPLADVLSLQWMVAGAGGIFLLLAIVVCLGKD